MGSLNGSPNFSDGIEQQDRQCVFFFPKFMFNSKSLPLSGRALAWLHSRSALGSALLEAPITRLQLLDLFAAALLLAVAFLCVLDSVAQYGLALVLLAVAARLAAIPLAAFVAAEEKKGGAQ